MSTPFFDARGPHISGPFGGGPLNVGFGQHERRALRQERRHARREFRDHVRGHDVGHEGPFGPGFGKGFGPGSGPGSFGPGFGPGRPGGRRGGHSRRGRRGDVRAAILVLLAERPMHGYEIIQEVAERSQDLWKPSPGSVYPTLQLLVDEGLIVGIETESSKKLFELTDAGRQASDKVATPPWDEITDGADPAQMNLRAALGQLFGAVAQAAHTASNEQQQRILDIVTTARREIYSILGEG